MTTTGLTRLALATVALLAAAPAMAHHSIAAEFDMNKPVTFTGTVTKIEWTNPHIYTHVEVKEPDGKVVEYRVEGGPPNALYRAGWRKDTLKPGDTVTVSGLRAKISTSMNIGVANVSMADGRKIFATGSPGPAAPAPEARRPEPRAASCVGRRPSPRRRPPALAREPRDRCLSRSAMMQMLWCRGD
jgi:hypothetical protein